LQEVLEELEAHGATLVALTPHLPEYSVEMTDKHSLNFHLLSDPNNAYAARLGLRWPLPEDLKQVYAGFGIDLPKFNGDDSWTLPIPARLVVDSAGIIRVADIDADYTRRPEPNKTLEDVAALTA